MSGSAVAATTDDLFEAEVLKANGAVLVDFWAPWCGPCKAMASVLESIAMEYRERVAVVKMNIDENPKTAPKFGIRGIPALVLFKGGRVEGQRVGAVTNAQLATFLDTHL